MMTFVTILFFISARVSWGLGIFLEPAFAQKSRRRRNKYYCRNKSIGWVRRELRAPSIGKKPQYVYVLLRPGSWRVNIFTPCCYRGTSKGQAVVLCSPKFGEERERERASEERGEERQRRLPDEQFIPFTESVY
jgi:hypothetical protein